ncbi:MAG: CaiB/BaiF CoA transferase family protein [Acidimicrobiales bacterium]
MSDGMLPLDDVRVLELGQLLAGPFCGQLLGDFGAEVIKVEDPRAGDPMRQWGRHKPQGRSLWWPIVARNKKSVTCNLRVTEGQQLLRDLVGHADVLVENFRPGTLERWGLGYDELAAINPRLVLVRVSGFGQDGPYSPQAGFGSIGEAMGGLRFITGEPDRLPSRVGISLGDALAGTFAALGAMVAVHARRRTGRGQVVDCAIYEAVLALMESTIPEWVLAHEERGRTGSILPNVAPSNVYRTADGEDIVIAANQDTVFSRLAALMGQAGLATDARFVTHDARGRNQDLLDHLIDDWSSQEAADALLGRLRQAGVPAGKIYRAKDMLEDPHYRARHAIVEVEHPVLGPFPMQNVAPRLSETPGSVRSVGPELGEHNAEVYGGLLDLEDDTIKGLVEQGVI